MQPYTHFISGLLVGLIGFRLGVIQPIDIIIIASITVLFDIDHFIAYIYYYKDFNIKKFFETIAEHKKHSKSFRTFIHHYYFASFMVIVCLILFNINVRAGFIVAGIYFTHILLDNLWIIPFFRKFKIIDVYGIKIMFSAREITFIVMMILFGSIIYLS